MLYLYCRWRDGAEGHHKYPANIAIITFFQYSYSYHHHNSLIFFLIERTSAAYSLCTYILPCLIHQLTSYGPFFLNNFLLMSIALLFVEGHLNANDLKPAYQALKKLCSLSM